MTIHPIVHRFARQFGGSSVAFETLIQSVVNAEGGIDRILAAVRCSVPETETTEEAVSILCRSAVHALADYIMEDDPPDFVEFWAKRWAPQGAKNDPTALNVNWPRNVIQGWLGKHVENKHDDR